MPDKIYSFKSPNGNHFVHGHARIKNQSPTYKTWAGIIARCINPKEPFYPDYGGRGIKVCERWRTFTNFLADMGERPPGLTIDRIDNSKGYEPGNCKWETMRGQSRNRRSNRVFTYKWVTDCLMELCEKFNTPYKRTWRRLTELGWTVDQAFMPGDGRLAESR